MKKHPIYITLFYLILVCVLEAVPKYYHDPKAYIPIILTLPTSLIIIEAHPTWDHLAIVIAAVINSVFLYLLLALRKDKGDTDSYKKSNIKQATGSGCTEEQNHLKSDTSGTVYCEVCSIPVLKSDIQISRSRKLCPECIRRDR